MNVIAGMGNPRGFTLIELLVVVAIIAILAAIAIPQYYQFLGRAKRAEAVVILNAIHKHEMNYFAAHDQFYPPSAPVMNQVIVPAATVVSYFGLVAIQTKLGWTLGDLAGFGSFNPGDQPASRGYRAAVSTNIDQDATDPDEFFIIHQRAPFVWNCPQEGIPILYYDDLQNFCHCCP